ncbi:MAG: hypothetical protein KJ667_02150 [Alphaproteobacteria bacterium]|nr:hypothetical protein [Alphaproteobacteria bacterium]
MQFDMFNVPEDVAVEDLKAAMTLYAEKNNNWFADAYKLWFRAEAMDNKYNAIKQDSPVQQITAVFMRAAYGYEREALRAQAHQNFRFAVAEKTGRRDYGRYFSDYFEPPEELLAMVKQFAIKRQNIANGHSHLYQP